MSPFFEMKKKLHRAQRGGGEDYASARELTGVTVNERGGLNCAYFVTGAAIARATQRFDVNHPGFGEEPRPVLFG